MNNEIKEILDKIQNVVEHKEASYNALIETKAEDYKLLLDYITKLQEDVRTGQEINNELQQENERLKDSIVWWKDRFFGQQEYDDSHRITAIEYKKRIDKAIEHIEEIWKSAEGGNIYVITIVGLMRADLLNILQNGSDDNE